jgi:hypothetical protein
MKNNVLSSALNPTFPPNLPLKQYPTRCSQCRCLVSDGIGPVYNHDSKIAIAKLVCDNGHTWKEVSV